MGGNSVKVIFIGGASRSGSTLLDRMVGHIDGFFSLGEVRYIWDRGFIQDRLCGCGESFSACEFWRAVVRDAFGTFDDADAKHMLELERSVQHLRHLPWLAFPSLRPPRYQAKLTEFADAWSTLYGAISNVSESKILVDSSKTAIHGFMLNTLSDIDLHVVHLVRDSRAVAYSWQRKKLLYPGHDETLMLRFGILHTTRGWILQNSLVQLLGKSALRYSSIPYADLANQPQPVMHQLLSDVGLQQPQLDGLLAGPVMELGANHMFSGNPMRFQQGKIEIRPDEEWAREMPFHKRAIVTAITWPLLLHWRSRRGSDIDQ